MEASYQGGPTTMIEVVYEFIIKDESRGQFELTFGPGGAWSKLFARSEGFRGTTVMRDVENPCRYLTIELWETADLREKARAEHQTDDSDLDSTLTNWTDSMIEVGIFRVMAEATVRPHGKTRRTKAGKHHRRQRRAKS
jgi:heme-degrading monooxygenase HmoA